MFQLGIKTQRVCLAFMSIALLGLIFVLTGCSIQQTSQHVSVVPSEKHVQLKLNIVLNQPGMQKDWPAYAPNNLAVPANSLVTVTLHDYDLGDTPLPQNTPFTTVQGAVGNTAYLNGVAYTALAPDKIAHTFTIPQLHLNIPLPGDGNVSDSITFTFYTGQAGMYMFQCFDPCGTGASGWEGPMITKGYMMGMLTVQ